MISFELDCVRGPIAGVSGGAGPPLIMVAGLGASHRVWGDLPEHLSRNFRVFAIDNRGIGGSRSGGAFTLEGAARDVLRIIEGFDLERVRLLGVSLGGLITLQAAILDQSRLDRIVTVSCSAHLSQHGKKNLKMFRDLFTHLPADSAGRALMTLAFAPKFHEEFPRFVDQAITFYGPDHGDIPGAIAQINALLNAEDLRSQLRGIVIPALVLAGALDPIVAPAETAEVAAMMSQATMRCVQGAAHAVLAEGGKKIFDEVVTFLRSDSAL